MIYSALKNVRAFVKDHPILTTILALNLAGSFAGQKISEYQERKRTEQAITVEVSNAYPPVEPRTLLTERELERARTVGVQKVHNSGDLEKLMKGMSAPLQHEWSITPDERKVLYERFNILFPERYTTGTLRNMLEHKAGGKRSDDEWKVAVEVFARDDYNGALSNPNTSLYKYNHVICEAEDRDDMVYRLRQIAEEWGPIDLLILSAHGSTSSITLSDRIALDFRKTENERGKVFWNAVSKELSPMASIVLYSCSTGIPKVNNTYTIEDSIGRKISDWTGRKVFAPLGNPSGMSVERVGTDWDDPFARYTGAATTLSTPGRTEIVDVQEYHQREREKNSDRANTVLWLWNLAMAAGTLLAWSVASKKDKKKETK